MAASKVVGFLLTLIIAAQYTGWRALDQAIAALLVLLGVAYLWSRWSPIGLGLERRLISDRAAVGEVLNESLRLSNHSRLPKLWLEVWDFSTLPGYRANRVMQVAGRSDRQWEVSVTCTRRGRFRLGPVTLRSGDPLGLFPRRTLIPVSHDVLVFPATVDVSSFPIPSTTVSGGRITAGNHPMQTSTIAGVRDYNPGDPLNRISWAATARSGRLMTKEFDLDPTSDVWIVLDLERSQHAAASYAADHPAYREPFSPWLDSTEECAITVAASLARRCTEEGRVVGLIATGDHLEVLAPDRSERQYAKILESLALERADGTLPLAECLTIEARWFKRQSAVIVITASVSDEWVKPLVDLTNRGILASVVLIEQETFAPATSSLMVVGALMSMEIPVALIKNGDDIRESLKTGTLPATPRKARFVHG